MFNNKRFRPIASVNYLFLTCLCLGLLLGSSQAGAQEHAKEQAEPGAGGAPTTARAALEAYTKDLQGLSARFHQLVISQDGEVMDEGTGQLWLQRPDRFRWYYEGDFPELIVADGEYVWIYDESLEQVNIREQGGAAGESPLLLLTDTAGLDERYQVTELGTITGSQLLQLRSRDPEAPFERLVLALEDGELKRLVLEDTFGLRTELELTELERNPRLPADHFTFTPPAGVDLLGDVPAYIARDLP